MLHVRVKSKDVSFSVPIPSMILNLGISILCSKMLQQHVNEWSKAYIEKSKIPFVIPPLDKSALKRIVDELKNHKGIVLVDIKAKDGTEVKIRL
ncbi:hypothetical protein JK635_12685 [Neobacillus sp. YIM B02564]|jgi:hypothetical protein|uniref:Uncharacterized protein n=2 Tax=Neobacillus TaxID=2675232 RepID=A0ABS1TS22_9BACI|nr:hypothetical protein [Neobacillus paridis]MBL4953066.1 hypothetical protein [Neobacillus paridis]